MATPIIYSIQSNLETVWSLHPTLEEAVITISEYIKNTDEQYFFITPQTPGETFLSGDQPGSLIFFEHDKQGYCIYGITVTNDLLDNFSTNITEYDTNCGQFTVTTEVSPMVEEIGYLYCRAIPSKN